MSTKRICMICGLEKPNPLRFSIRDEDYCPTCQGETKTLTVNISEETDFPKGNSVYFPYGKVMKKEEVVRKPKNYTSYYNGLVKEEPKSKKRIPEIDLDQEFQFRFTNSGGTLYYLLDTNGNKINIFV